MGAFSANKNVARVLFVLLPLLLVITALITVQEFYAAGEEPVAAAVYTHGVLKVSVPYSANRAGSGELRIDILDPEDHVVGAAHRSLELKAGKGSWQEDVRLDNPLPLNELIWHRLRCRFEYAGDKKASIESTESISQIIRTPVIHILGQQSYLSGGPAAVRVIVTDSKNQVIAGRGMVRIELLLLNQKPRVLFDGKTNRRGTTEAQFRLPEGLVGSYRLRYVVDTPIGSTEYTQSIRLEDKVSILLTTEKPIYQPSQRIHARALALDRADHTAAANRKLTFELEDSRGNEVFKRATETDKFGIASAEFALADEVNLGTYHLRALMGEPDAPSNTAEIALNVERYVLPKFKVAIDFAGKDNRAKRGYRPGDHVTGTVHANYFFGKPVDQAEIAVKASSMDVAVVEAGSSHGKTDPEGDYHFDLRLPDYFAGLPLNQGVGRVLIEATVKDSAGHSETRGEGITVSESPLLITAIPEGGTLASNLENQVFVLTSYPDGTPARSNVRIHVEGADSNDQRVATDDGGVAVATIKAGSETANILLEADDKDGNHASSKLQLQTRTGDEQILVRADRGVYRAGDRISLSVFSTRQRGTAYIDVVKEGQTVLTRDVDLEDGRAQLSLIATPELAGTVDFNAYLFGRNAVAVGDHRLVFVQPADDLRIETTSDSPVYKPGVEARIRLRVTNSRGEGVHAALGLQVVDEAVFALAEKQPGFAKVFFYLEQEVMKPRYEIHSLSMPEVVQPSEESKLEQHDRAARALLSATELVNTNKFQTEFGRALPMEKFPEYLSRYRDQFRDQVNRLGKRLSEAYEKNSEGEDLAKVFAKMEDSDRADTHDSWDGEFRIDRVNWYRDKNRYLIRSAGADGVFNTGDDMTLVVEVRPGKIVNRADANSSAIAVNIEHERGPFNGLAEITGTVTDPSGAVIANARVEIRDTRSRKTRTALSNDAGQFTFSGVPASSYDVRITCVGFNSASGRVTLAARDRAVADTSLNIGASSETVEVSAAQVAIDIGTGSAVGIGGGVVGGVAGGIRAMAQAAPAPMNGRSFTQFDRLESFAALKTKKEVSASGAGAESPHIRSYFPEALYINPAIITDQDGVASITIPMADSITTWRMAVLASTVHGALGTATSSLKVFQDFFVDLDLPVTLTQGDRVSIPVAAYNYSPSRGNVSLKLKREDWFSLVDDAEKSVSVDAGRVGGLQFTIETKHIGKFKLTLSARMNGRINRADIVVREIEVIPNGREQNIVFNGRLENTVRQELVFPAASIPDASKILVRLYPGPLSQVIEGMDSILRMPGGCFEQTSSSTYPNVLALDYMKRTKKLTPEVHAKAEGYIANGYQRLLTFEVPGGGFSWFGRAPANKILTSYGLMEFSDMSKVYDVDANLIARTQQWLVGQQQSDGSWKPDAQFINEGATNRYNSDVLRITGYIAWSLENTGYEGAAVQKAKHYIESHLSGKIDTYTLAVLANFAVDFRTTENERDREFIREVMQLLLDARTEKDEQAWWSAEETGVYATGESASVETTGLAVQALLKWGGASGAVRKAMNLIAAKKNANGTWGTTQATIMALRALLLATEKGAADVHGNLEILLNGKSVQKLELTSENNDMLHQFVFKDVVTGGNEPDGIEVKPEESEDANPRRIPKRELPNTVEIRFDGNGGLAYQIVGNYFLPWDEKPANEALSIDVRYDRTHLAQDDVATATATIKSNLTQTAKMVMVDLGIPPGFDLLSEDLQDYVEKSALQKSGRLEKFSQTATQAILYFDSIAARDSITLRFRLRAKYPIRARTFQSRVYEYYDPDVSSVARPVQLEVSRR